MLNIIFIAFRNKLEPSDVHANVRLPPCWAADSRAAHAHKTNLMHVCLSCMTWSNYWSALKMKLAFCRELSISGSGVRQRMLSNSKSRTMRDSGQSGFVTNGHLFSVNWGTCQRLQVVITIKPSAQRCRIKDDSPSSAKKLIESTYTRLYYCRCNSGQTSVKSIHYIYASDSETSYNYCIATYLTILYI